MGDRHSKMLVPANRQADLVSAVASPVLTLARCSGCGATAGLKICIHCRKPVCPHCRGTGSNSYLNMGDQKGYACAACLETGEVHEDGPLRRFGRLATQTQRLVNGVRSDGRDLVDGIRTEIRDVVVPEIRNAEAQARALVRDGLWGTTDRIGWWVTVIVLIVLLLG